MTMNQRIQTETEIFPQGSLTQREAEQPLWPLRLVGLFLFLQSLGLIGLFFYYGHKANLAYNLQLVAQFGQELTDRPQAVQEAFTFGFFFLPLAFLMLLAALAFAFLRRSGWMLGMIAQCLALFFCISFYFSTTLRMIFPVMVVSVLMVLYLNSRAIRTLFRAHHG